MRAAGSQAGQLAPAATPRASSRHSAAAHPEAATSALHAWPSSDARLCMPCVPSRGRSLAATALDGAAARARSLCVAAWQSARPPARGEHARRDGVACCLSAPAGAVTQRWHRPPAQRRSLAGTRTGSSSLCWSVGAVQTSNAGATPARVRASLLTWRDLTLCVRSAACMCCCRHPAFRHPGARRLPQLQLAHMHAGAHGTVACARQVCAAEHVVVHAHALALPCTSLPVRTASHRC